MSIKNGDRVAGAKVRDGFSFSGAHAWHGGETKPGHKLIHLSSGRSPALDERLRDHDGFFAWFGDDTFDFDLVAKGQVEQPQTAYVLKRCRLPEERNVDVALCFLSDMKIGGHRERETGLGCLLSMRDFEIALRRRV